MTERDTRPAGEGSADSGAESVAPSTTYSRTGDDGSTALGDQSRTGKADLRIVAYGEYEEAGAAIGMVIALGAGLSDEVITMLARLQNDLVDVGADLCAPLEGQPTPALRIDTGYVERLERACDHFDADLPALPAFVVPGGTATAAMLHRARAVVRRAERATQEAHQHHGEHMNSVIGGYLNRLASLLFILARGANAEHGDTLWQPGLSAQLGETELWEMPVPEPVET
ncbi:MAG: cob(I)yrinic acid a,c-diamide adenosyltransferase [Pseudonocardiaceae bacterium]|nr:cob(I)yrinic acid a,c-diamide adenosyltransferase [Pseudonocardiaceae bacterium]